MLRNAQISIFVIIAVIIIFVVGFLFYLGDFSLFFGSQSQLQSEIQEHIEACIFESTQTGVFLLGFQGGYINVSEDIILNPDRRLVFGADGDFQEGAFTMPNWDSQRGDIPTRESMEEELSEYVEDNSPSCISSRLSAYDDYLTIDINFSAFSVETIINDLNIEVISELPVSVVDVSEEIEFDLSSYYVDYEVPLGDMYDLAVDIFNMEVQTLVFEELVLDQIYSASSDSSEDISMPTEGMSFSCSPHVWTKTELKQTLAQLNNNNFNYFHIEGTRSIENRFESNLGSDDLEDLQEYYRAHYHHNLQTQPKESYENYEVNVMMPTAEVTGSQGYFNEFPYREFDVSPSQGEVVRSMDIKIGSSLEIPVPCIQIFHHLYTLDYDLMIRLNDFTHGEQEFLFQFPLRIEIEDNAPKSAPQTSVIQTESPTVTDVNYCAEESRTTETAIYVQDVQTNEYLAGADVRYECIALGCDLGETQRPSYEFNEDIEREDAIPVIETNLGFCDGGDLSVELDGYHQIGTDPDRIEAGTEEAIPPITALMAQTKEFPITALTFDAVSYRSCQSFPRGEDRFFISIENEGYDFESSAMYPNNADGFMDSISLLRIPDAAYNISVVYTRNGEAHGLMELEDVVLDYDRGNRLQVDVPATTQPLGEESIVDYFDDVELVLENEHTCLGLDFGVGVR